MGFTTLENWISAMLAQNVMDDPLIMGLLVLALFLFFVILQGQKFEVKVVIMVPAAMLALAVMNFQAAVLLFAIAAAGILFFGLWKWWNR